MGMERRQVFAWAMYDWANSAFATTVMAGFFPLFFKQFYAAGNDVVTSTAQLGFSNSVASLAVALIAPVLGAVADAGLYKKRFLLFFAVIGILMSAALSLVDRGMWELAALVYVAASVGFAGSNIFYDSLLPTVAGHSERDRVSILGFALGYLGGGLLFLLNVLMYQYPDFFGIPSQVTAVKLSFVSVAVWWALFSIPLALFVKERTGKRVALLQSIKGGYENLAKTFKKVTSLKTVSLFLVAYWLYIDGVDTIIRMAVDYGISIGLEAPDLIMALLIVQFVGFPATLIFGKLSNTVNTKTLILSAVGVYLLVTLWAAFIEASRDFFILALLIGMVQGGIQALSRSFYSRIIPHKNAAEFFGFYNFLGKFAAIIGPALIGVVALASGSTRVGVVSIVILFIAGGWLLLKVDEAQGVEEARRFEKG